MDHTMPGLPVHHQLPEFTQTHVHLVSDAIQPSHPMLSPSPPALNLSQHQGLFQWVSSSHQVAKVLEFQGTYYTSSVHYGHLCLGLPWRWGVPGVESEHAYSRPGAVTHWLVILGVALSFLICQMCSINYASDSLPVTLCTSGLSGTALSHRRPSLSALEVRK